MFMSPPILCLRGEIIELRIELYTHRCCFHLLPHTRCYYKFQSPLPRATHIDAEQLLTMITCRYILCHILFLFDSLPTLCNFTFKISRQHIHTDLILKICGCRRQTSKSQFERCLSHGESFLFRHRCWETASRGTFCGHIDSRLFASMLRFGLDDTI